MTNQFQVLLVEDHITDVIFTRQAFSKYRLPTKLHTAIDGVEATAFLRKEGRHSAAPRPDLILLDLHMPRKDGRAVLKEVKQDPKLQTIPVVFFTSSASPPDVLEMYQNHANGYVVKPASYEDFDATLFRILDFWLGIATLPHSSP